MISLSLSARLVLLSNGLRISAAAGDVEQSPRHITFRYWHRIHKVLSQKPESMKLPKDMPAQAASKYIGSPAFWIPSHYMTPTHIIECSGCSFFQPQAPIELVWHPSLSIEPLHNLPIGWIERFRYTCRRKKVLCIDEEFGQKRNFYWWFLICTQTCCRSMTTLRVP